MNKPSTSPAGSKRSARAFLVPILIALIAVALIIYSILQGTNDAPDSAKSPTPNPTETSQESAPSEEQGAPDTSNGAEPNSEEPTDAERLEMYAELAELAKHDSDDPLSMGEPDAPLTMLIYSDFRCPYCGQWERTTLPQIIDEYVDSGQMRLEWRDMAILGDSSTDAAHAAGAAAKQGKFWEFASALYEESFQSEASDSDYAPESMADLAEELGLDRAQFLEDIKDDAIIERVDADRSEAWSLGFTGTPAFLIEGVPVIGAQPIETFEGAIQYRLDQLQDQN